MTNLTDAEAARLIEDLRRKKQTAEAGMIAAKSSVETLQESYKSLTADLLKTYGIKPEAIPQHIEKIKAEIEELCNQVENGTPAEFV